MECMFLASLYIIYKYSFSRVLECGWIWRFLQQTSSAENPVTSRDNVDHDLNGSHLPPFNQDQDMDRDGGGWSIPRRFVSNLVSGWRHPSYPNVQTFCFLRNVVDGEVDMDWPEDTLSPPLANPWASWPISRFSLFLDQTWTECPETIPTLRATTWILRSHVEGFESSSRSFWTSTWGMDDHG